MFPRDVAHGPLSHGELGLPHLLTIQGTSQIALLIDHIRQNDVNGKLALACLDTAQLIAGVSAPLLEHPSLSYPHLEDPWLDSHQPFLAECNAKLIISCAWTPTLFRDKDRYIMEVANKSTTTPIDRRHFNQCRKYLKVQRLSDRRRNRISTGSPLAHVPEPQHRINPQLAASGLPIGPCLGHLETNPPAPVPSRQSRSAPIYETLNSPRRLDDRHIVSRHLLALLLRHQYRQGVRALPRRLLANAPRSALQQKPLQILK
jgi:hypothetical protein